jgi:hypothetical protein
MKEDFMEKEDQFKALRGKLMIAHISGPPTELEVSQRENGLKVLEQTIHDLFVRVGMRKIVSDVSLRKNLVGQIPGAAAAMNYKVRAHPDYGVDFDNMRAWYTTDGDIHHFGQVDTPPGARRTLKKTLVAPLDGGKRRRRKNRRRKTRR